MPRYAIYFMPETGTPLATFGSRAIGYDAESGGDVAFHGHPFYRRASIQKWTESPRRYGFHATLKAPFELKDGYGVDDLLMAAREFSVDHAALSLGHLGVNSIGGFVALTPSRDDTGVGAFAADCVRTFEPFRAALSQADIARRLRSPLTNQQRANLDLWGYPYVFDAYRFHMTLSGTLPDQDTVSAAQSALAELYQPIDQAVQLNAITIAEQPARNARFQVLARLALATPQR